MIAIKDCILKFLIFYIRKLNQMIMIITVIIKFIQTFHMPLHFQPTLDLIGSTNYHQYLQNPHLCCLKWFLKVCIKSLLVENSHVLNDENNSE